MIEFNAGNFLSAYNRLSTFSQLLRRWELENNHNRIQNPVIVNNEEVKQLKNCVAFILSITNPIGFAATETFAHVLFDRLGKISLNGEGLGEVVGYDLTRLNSAVNSLCDAIPAEARGRPFLALGPGDVPLWNPRVPLFSARVDEAFPSARGDIEEAAKCLAVGRYTACVMHLMRATEVPLKALCASVGVGPQNDWGAYIRELDKEIDAREKSAGKRTADEQFYSELARSFDSVKRAWRNRTMHIDAVYTGERSASIYSATRDFMIAVAERVKG